MNSIVLVSFAPDPSQGLHLQKGPEALAFHPSLDVSPQEQAGGGQRPRRHRRALRKADSPCRLWLWPLLALFVSKLQPERSVPKG